MFAPTLSMAWFVAVILAMSTTIVVLAGNAAPLTARIIRTAPSDVPSRGTFVTAADAALERQARETDPPASRKIRVILRSPFDN